MDEHAAEMHGLGAIFGCAGLVFIVILTLVLFSDNLIEAIALYCLLGMQVRVARMVLSLKEKADALYKARDRDAAT